MKLPLPLRQAESMDLLMLHVIFPATLDYKHQIAERANSKGMISPGYFAILETILTMNTIGVDFSTMAVRKLREIAVERHGTCSNLGVVTEVRDMLAPTPDDADSDKVEKVEQSTGLGLVSYYILSRFGKQDQDEISGNIQEHSHIIASLALIEKTGLPKSRNVGMYEAVVQSIEANSSGGQLTQRTLMEQVRLKVGVVISASTAMKALNFASLYT